MESMTPSSEMPKNIQLGQIGKLQELLAARLRKSTLLSAPTQEVIEDPVQAEALLDEWENSLRRRVEARSGMIVRKVRVDRKLTPQQMLDATGRKQYTDSSVVASMPKGEGEEVTMYFFQVKVIDGHTSNDDLEKEFQLRGLGPDPIAQGRVNTDDSAFADEHPNGCHWKDADGNWCFETFHRWDDGERSVYVYRSHNVWDDNWWFGGVRKVS